jgi:hypothetical protein
MKCTAEYVVSHLLTVLEHLLRINGENKILNGGKGEKRKKKSIDLRSTRREGKGRLVAPRIWNKQPPLTTEFNTIQLQL